MESYTIIKAPIFGQIIAKHINLGEMALPGQPLVKIEDNRNLRLEVTVREQELRYIQTGKPVIVQIDALSGRDIKGTVAQVVPASDVRTHSFIVKIDIPSDKSLITACTARRCSASAGARHRCRKRRSWSCRAFQAYLISAGGSAVFQMVQLGDVSGDSVEAVTGLKAGDQVIVSRHETRLDGRKVVSK
jgi:multidrug efflux pump subunit AcrA (membrane-fusion protein)